ncbi:MAG: metallophosphoesterase, partial [Rhodothermales bacterium]|nr:metallophosphoesterase [Rhodothermales bacterium]
HHHLVRLRALGPHDVARGAKRALEAAAQSGVELILCGHLHQSHVEHVEIDVELGHRLVIASAGTATSSRGRRSNRKVNFYNHICVWPEAFVVEERRFEPDSTAFEPERASRFERERIAEPSGPA